MKLLGCALAVVLGSAAPAVFGSTIDPVQVQLVQATTGRAEGEIRKVDKAAGKLTVRHGAIQGLDMPGMTMVFPVKDRSTLDKVSVGDKVKFEVEQAGGALTIIGLQKLN